MNRERVRDILECLASGYSYEEIVTVLGCFRSQISRVSSIMRAVAIPYRGKYGTLEELEGTFTPTLSGEKHSWVVDVVADRIVRGTKL